MTCTGVTFVTAATARLLGGSSAAGAGVRGSTSGVESPLGGVRGVAECPRNKARTKLIGRLTAIGNASWNQRRGRGSFIALDREAFNPIAASTLRDEVE